MRRRVLFIAKFNLWHDFYFILPGLSNVARSARAGASSWNPLSHSWVRRPTLGSLSPRAFPGKWKWTRIKSNFADFQHRSHDFHGRCTSLATNRAPTVRERILSIYCSNQLTPRAITKILVLVSHIIILLCYQQRNDPNSGTLSNISLVGTLGPNME